MGSRGSTRVAKKTGTRIIITLCHHATIKSIDANSDNNYYARQSGDVLVTRGKPIR